MSTQIPTAAPEYFDGHLVEINVDREGRPGVVVYNGSASASVRIERNALFDAIRTELGAIVIDKTELPEVTVANDDRFVEINGESYGIKGLRLSREFHEQEAREHLAILRWLNENPPEPPVDFTKVKALSDVLDDLNGFSDADTIVLATRLLATGRIDIKDPS